MSSREWALTALVGVAWFAVYSVALNAGEQYVDAGTASMLIQFAPILIGVLAGILLGEGFPRMLVIGGLVAFAGTLIIGFATSTGEADLAGVLLVLLSATVYSIAMVAQKVVLRRIPALQVTWLACLIGTVACLPFAGALVGDLSVAPTRCRSWESSTSDWCRLRSPSRPGRTRSAIHRPENLVSPPSLCRRSPIFSVAFLRRDWVAVPQGGAADARDCRRRGALRRRSGTKCRHRRRRVFPLPPPIRPQTEVSVPSGM